MSGPRLEIVIDELVVRGVDPADAQTVSGEIGAQLTMLAGQSADRPTDRSEYFRRLPVISAPAGSPQALGGAVATAVWTTLTGGGGA
jgi:hypothetical protein